MTGDFYLFQLRKMLGCGCCKMCCLGATMVIFFFGGGFCLLFIGDFDILIFPIRNCFDFFQVSLPQLRNPSQPVVFAPSGFLDI